MNVMPQSVSPALIPAAPMAKTAIQPASLMLGSGRTPETAIQGVFPYTNVPGAASFVAASPDGSLWALSTAGPSGNDKFIYHYVSGTWTNISGAASRLAVAPNGTLLAINSGGGVYSNSGGIWTAYGGGATDITAGADGSIYVLSNGNSAGSNQAIWHYTGTWAQVPGAGVRIAGSWDTNSYNLSGAGSGSINPGGFYILNAAGNIYYENTNSTFAQLPGSASAITPVTDGGVFLLGYPASGSGNSIYYYDLDNLAFSTQTGAAIGISTNSTTFYVLGAGNGIYSSTVKAAQTWAFGGSSTTVTATAGLTPSVATLSAYNNISGSVQFPLVASGSGSFTLSDALNNGDVTPGTLPADNATSSLSPVSYASYYNQGPVTISFGTTTPAVTLTKSTGFGGATGCELDVYNNQGQGTPLTWFGIPATGAISGNTVTVPSITLPPGNTVLIKPGQLVTAIACGTSLGSTQSVVPAGGSFTVPAFAGFTGSVGYTSNNASGATVTLTSSLTPVLGEPTGSGVVFYLNALLTSSSSVIFNSGTATVTLTSSALLSNKTYNVNIYVSGIPISSTNAGSPTNGSLSFNSPISAQTVPAGTNVVIEIVQN